MSYPRIIILLFTFSLVLACSGGSPTLETARTERRADGRANDYPIVLVHGFMGFGRDEMFGFKYWGGFTDLEEELCRAGYETYTAAVGPVTSVWDRACELYACIKGGRVDYGETHSRLFGHDRYGRSYPGLYPEWGEVDPATGKVRKVHIIGHSLGGPTDRTLIQLLEQGSPLPGQGDHPLFRGGKSWVCSLATLSSPHDGTTYAYRYDWGQSLIKPTFAFLISLSSSSPELYFDFKLDQWGLARRPGEDFYSYRDRVVHSDIWSHSKDTAYWDGSPEGAMELNGWVRAQPSVYYFSWATEATYRDPLSGTQVPEIGVPGRLATIARFIGSYSQEDDTELPIDSSWWQNDGIVNTSSMDGPTLGSTDTIQRFSGAPVRGSWNYMGLLESVDHLDIIGIPIADSDLKNWYLSLAALLTSLPDGQPSATNAGTAQ
jgi:triacylglycerol lipase